ncbi:uracil-DNA glycosylase [Paenibacillus chartarius]|uniref:Uracil-DNA glycosylase n=1 Tax=Paenibacillus chartarius TaxID=747481 RepID=A0ABV6DF45_9BACL
MGTILLNDWRPLLEDQFEEPYYVRLREFLKEEYRTRQIYPGMHDIFNALHLTPYDSVKAVILGQDPYHGAGQAHGLSFSVKPGVDVPPSLQNMYKELQSDLGVEPARHGHLVSWAEQGVLLLNAVLTVREGEPNSHKGQGWERFTDRIIGLLSERERPIVFLLWGANAQAKAGLIDGTRHHIIRSPHPSPLSAHRGFFGSRPFSRTNAFLRSIGSEPIDWRLPER